MTKNRWLFSPRGFNDMDHEVTEGDQFNTETVERTEALVREATQNTQDARDKQASGPVRLRIAVVDGSNGLDADFLNELVAGLKPHLESSHIQLSTPPISEPSALLVEDFGTTGLTGAVDDEDDHGDFRSFFFCHGQSYKDGNKNGRWGLGKLVYPLTSASRCFFGLTIRKDDPTPILLGQAVVKTHKIDAQRYAPHGHFGDATSKELRPITDPAFISRFKNAFNLKRTDEVGLSVVVPFPVSKTDRNELLTFIVKNYAYPILTNRLVIDVLDERVDAENVRTIGKELLSPGLIEFIDDAHNLDHAELIPVKPRALGATERITKELLDVDIDELRKRYIDGELLGFRVPIQLKRKDDSNHQAYVDIFFRSGAESEEGAALCVRGDLTVPDEAKKFASAGTFSMLLAHQEEVSEFLADAENPAHTKWLSTAERLRSNWRYPGQTLAQVRNAPISLHKLLATGKEHIDRDALKHFFWVEDPSAPADKHPSRKNKRKKDCEEPGPSPFPPLPPSKKRLVLNRRKGGFSIRPGVDFAELSLPVGIRVAVRYDVEYGKPQWDAMDFDLAAGEVRTIVKGGEVDAEGNILLFMVEEPDFSLTVEGFDTNRDLVVDYNLIKQMDTIDA